jgi:hypothetical protein
MLWIWSRTSIFAMASSKGQGNIGFLGPKIVRLLRFSRFKQDPTSTRCVAIITIGINFV